MSFAEGLRLAGCTVVIDTRFVDRAPTTGFFSGPSHSPVPEYLALGYFWSKGFWGRIRDTLRVVPSGKKRLDMLADGGRFILKHPSFDHQDLWVSLSRLGA